MAYDIIIRSGLMLDGAGKPPVVQDIAIENGRIAGIGAVGRANPPPARGRKKPMLGCALQLARSLRTL